MSSSEGTRINRRHALRWWLASNGLWASQSPRLHVPEEERPEYWKKLVAEADKTVGKIRSGKIDPYQSINVMIDCLKKENRASSSIVGYRYVILKFLRYSQVGITYEATTESVKKIRRVHVLASKLPTPDQIRGVLLASPLKVKVLISTMISTGGRLSEVLSIRRDDLDSARRPAMVYFRGEETKTGHSRIGFLSSEAMTLIGYYLKVRKSDHQYLFDGFEPHETGKKRDVDRPMSKNSAWGCVRRAFRRLEMNQRSPQGHYYHHPNVLRTFSLALLKTGGYPPDWAEYLVGHSLGTQAHYVPPTETLASEWLKIEHRFCFLGNPLRYEGPVGSLAWNPEETSSGRDHTNQAMETSANAMAFMKATQADEASVAQRWVSNSYYYVKANISSFDYDQALADGYSLFDSRADGLRVLRKRRVVSV